MYDYPTFQDKIIIPSKEAQREMDEIGINLWKVKEILENGYDVSVNQRKENIIEKAMIRKNKEIRVVVALVERSDIGYWVVTHVGKTGKH